jgi:hypothetical protein
MQDRLTIAEDAWDKARPRDMSESTAFDRSSVSRLESARDSAIAMILEVTQCEAIQARAIKAIMEAVGFAVEQSSRDDSSGILALVTR